MKNKNIQNIVFSALISAMYAGLTFINPLSFGEIQFRASEILTILAVITPTAIPGLTIGCIIANFASFMPLDMIFGSMATLLAALTAWLFRKIRIKKLPVLSGMMPVFFNSVIVGAQLCLYSGTYTLNSFLIFALSVGIGELIVCTIAIFLFPAFEKLFSLIQKK